MDKILPIDSANSKKNHDFCTSKNDSITYENEQEKVYRIIESMTEEKAKELGISRRSLFYWKQKIREGKQIILKNKLKIMLISNIIKNSKPIKVKQKLCQNPKGE